MYFINKQTCKLFLNFSETFSSKATFGGVFCVHCSLDVELVAFFFFLTTLLSDKFLVLCFKLSKHS